MIEAVSEEFVYGPAELRGMLLKALQMPEKYLLKPHYRRIQKFLLNADTVGLFKAQAGAAPEELGIGK